jgi:hypothetical protein
VSTELLERRGRAARPAVDAVPRNLPATDSRGGPTLDELITGVWEGLSANESVHCPACGGAMSPRYAAGPCAVGGRCSDCGSTLS